MSKEILQSRLKKFAIQNSQKLMFSKIAFQKSSKFGYYLRFSSFFFQKERLQ